MVDLPKKEIQLDEFSRSENDTGSPEFQIALLTKRIILLTGHLKQHAHDYSTRRGLLKTVGKRRKLLKYLSQKDVAKYNEVLSKLSLRR
jgi:small subunit ribosomal protein S15|tara:strand:+ start:214 stop:480 length:267 start_codon:yes stop_codon:yes gene_type:complete